jgi:hypothetical protein
MFINKFYLNISMRDLVLKDLLKRIQWCNWNLIWVFNLWVIIFFLARWNSGAHLLDFFLSPLSPLGSACMQRGGATAGTGRTVARCKYRTGAPPVR